MEKNMEESLELRMFGFVPYNLSPIQQGIQFGHAVVEYGLLYFDTELYQNWAKNWKTFIIYNGGTTNNGLTYKHVTGEEGPTGTMNRTYFELMNQKINIATFNEIDLGDQLTAIVFIADERVFNFNKYPNFDPNGPFSYDDWVMRFNVDDKTLSQIMFLRSFLLNFRLA
jgi:hypothetical protein